MVPFKSRYQGCGRGGGGGGTDPVRAPAPPPRTLSSGVNSGSSNRGHGSAGRGFAGLRWVDHVVGRRGRSPTVRPSGEGARAVLSTAPPPLAGTRGGRGDPGSAFSLGPTHRRELHRGRRRPRKVGGVNATGLGSLKRGISGGGRSAHRQAWGGRGWRGC